MKFKVRFTNSETYPVYIEECPIGLQHVDQIRADLAVPELPLDIITGTIAVAREKPLITISENMARLSGHYRRVSEISVNCSHRFLNKYMFLVAGQQNNNDGEIMKAWLYWYIDTDAVLDAWEKVKFPLGWGALG